MNAARRHRLDPAVRDRLFAVATEAFVRDGYERASLNAILAEAGVGKSTFFYYFVDKDDLFATVIEAAVARITAAVGAFELPASPRHFWREARAIMERWGYAAATEPGFLGLLRAMQPLRRAASSRLAQVMSEVRLTYRALLVRGVELGVVRDDIEVDTLIALTDAVDVALDDEFHQNPDPDDDAVAAHRARVFDVIQRMLRK
jgi:AcrR family transcriptional regulator